MDLKQLRYSSDPKSLDLLHPIDQTPLRQENGAHVTISLISMDSEAAKKVDRKILDGRLKNTVNKRKVQITAKQIEEEEYQRVAACIVGWDGMVLEGQPVEFSKDNVMMILKEFPWIYNQVKDFLDDEANFITA